VLKRGTLIKNIHLTDEADEIEGRTDKEGRGAAHEIFEEGVNLISSSRHCEEPTGRANARPMTGSATKQSLFRRRHGLLRFARNDGRGARRKPLKPLRAGTSGDSGVLVVARVRSTNTKCTRGCGCNGHPAFPTPSLGGRFIEASGASRGRGREVVFSRHCERSEAIHSFFAARCIASLRSQ